MASKSASLRLIKTSGGLFTENILLRLRDNPKRLNIGKVESFLEKNTTELRNQFKKERTEIFKWCCDTWDNLSTSVTKFSLNEIIDKWLVPLFNQFGHELEEFELEKKDSDEDNPLKDFKISHQSKDHKNPFFHFVGENENFKDKINNNPQNRPYHNICQQFVNFNPEIKWLLLSNGRILHILTKYYHTYSTGYVRFDLENIFANRDNKEFNVLYAMIHQSRFVETPKEKAFLIDLFKKQSASEGIKIGDSLRYSVEKAIQLLGNSLIQQNPEFLDEILSIKDDLSEILDDFYAELLRIIYRIIFILYAEKRKMLPVDKGIYLEHFSLSSMRKLAEKQLRVEKNRDQWEKLFTTFKIIRDGNDLLEVNSFNGSLFEDKNLPIIVGKELSVTNDIIIRVIRLLTTFKDANIRQKINFSIEEEEIGSIYESLLDLRPHFMANSGFKLKSQTTERKSTGSYYTPKSLIDILIRTTLQPLVEDRLKEAGNDVENRKKAILDLKVCDPACGGGTFLLSAMDFLGMKLAEARTNSESPLESDLREARRDILQHCIYGVDMNPLAVELAKISLWLRACVKDKPLNFLDNHIKCGNSLVGLGQKTEIETIDPISFKAISGNKETGILAENTKLQNMARKYIRNEILEQKKDERKISTITAFMMEKKTADICSVEFQKIIDLSEDNPEEIIEKEKQYNNLKKTPKYQQALNEANIWTSCYFWYFEGDSLGDMPNNTLINELRDGIQNKRIDNLLEKINKITKENQLFHWYIEFPDVFSSERGGFDSILTNPPWEALQLKEAEFFTGLNEEILKAPNQAKRRKLIKELKDKKTDLFNQFKKVWQNSKKMTHFLTKSGLFDLSAKGTINTYALFVERCWRIIAPNGYVGIVCPTGVIMNYYMQELFRALVNTNSILSMFDFINNKALFDIHRDYRFCLLSLGGKEISNELIPMTFYTLDPIEIQEPLSLIFDEKNNLREKLKRLPNNHILIPLEQEDFKLFNPNTITCPSFRNRKDSELLRHLYKQTTILIKKDIETGEIFNPWDIEFQRMIDMSNDSSLFFDRQKLNDLDAKPLNPLSSGNVWIDKHNKKYFPLYEGRLIWHYNHRLNSMGFAEVGKKRKAISTETKFEEYSNPFFSAVPNYWISEMDLNEKNQRYSSKKWFIGFRDITGNTNERSFISTIIPYTAAGNTLPLLQSDNSAKDLCLLLANINSIVFDYIVRLKISGLHINFYILEQFPVFKPNDYNNNLKSVIISRVLELTYNSYDIKEFAEELEYDGEPFKWELESRAQLQAELDAIYALLYKIKREDLIYILETFPVLKRKEMKKNNEYRTKKLILKAYDEFSKQKELFE